MKLKGRIPITIHPAFWMFSALIGFINSFSLIGTLIWMLVILISVLFHELGHAITALAFKRHPRIDLVALGGLTFHDGSQISKPKQFLIVLNGPLFGFLLFLGSAVIFNLLNPEGYLKVFLSSLIWVNLFWTIINLLPILPLDGGQLLRILLEGVWGSRGTRYALLVSTVVGGSIALACFLYSSYFLGALVFMFAFQSFDSFRKSKNMKDIDQQEDLKVSLANAEMLIAQNKNEEAMRELESIREKTQAGLLYDVATQDLAYILFKASKFNEVYLLLKPKLKSLSEEALVLLHNAAFSIGDQKLVAELSGVVYQTVPSFENAIRNAMASASSSNVVAAMGWLETAKEYDKDLLEVLSNSNFDNIRGEKLFKEFTQALTK